MPPKADSPDVPVPPAEPGVSGKWVIVGILAVALAAAGGSWLFRYTATHRTAEFWGPQAVQLIRDARIVRLVPNERDVSSAKGLTHLRNALLEDRSFVWPATALQDGIEWKSGLAFRDVAAGTSAVLMFSSDFQHVRNDNTDQMLCCESIAEGLREMFAEFAAAGASAPTSPAPPAAEAASPNADAAK